MLQALSEQLKTMSLDHKDPFTKHIRSIVGAREAPRFEGPLRKMILSMPAMIRQIRLWADESDQPWNVKRLQVFALAYLYNPTDFLPEKSHGFFGYLDDAYLIVRVYEETLDEVPLAGIASLSEEEKFSDHIGEWIRLTQELLPNETRRMDEMLDQYEGGKKRTYAFSR